MIRLPARSSLFLVGVSILVPLSAARADGPVQQDQSAFTLDNSYKFSSFASADDFVVTSAARVSRATIWVADNVPNDNGVIDSFSGAIGWSIWTDSSTLPGSLVASGEALDIVQVDSGAQDDFGDDIVAVSFALTHPVSLAPGTYWFALHEGQWGQAGDGSEVWWAKSSSANGSGHAAAPDPAHPIWAHTTGDNDVAFVLYDDAVVWDQSPIAAGGSGGSDIADYVTANDVVLATSASFSSIEAWLLDETVGDNGSVDSFSGAMSWAIYDDSNGAPGALRSGDSGDCATVETIDTGYQSTIGSDEARVRCSLGRSVLLAPGTYWLALHEGSWLSPFDGSQVYWIDSTLALGGGQYQDGNEGAPGTSWSTFPYDSAFVLGDQLLFASGFEAGVTCAWSNGGALACP